MATEYKLSYTGSEINEKLSKIDTMYADINQFSSEIVNEVESALTEAKVSGEFDGRDGYTPARGIDYWTDEDKNKISEDISKEISTQIEVLHLLPYGGSKEWLESNGDKTKLYQIDGYVWGYIESNGWTKSGTRFLVVTNKSQMTNVGGTEYLLRSGNEGTVYSYTEASGDVGVPVYSTLPTTANAGDIVAVGGRKYKASLTTEEKPAYTNLAVNLQEDVRIKSDGTIVEASGITVCLDYIPFTQGAVVRIKGFGNLKDCNTAYYTAAKGLYSVGRADVQTSMNDYDYNANTDITTLTANSSATGYIRVVGVRNNTADALIVTANEEIVNKTVTIVTWTDIGEYIAPVEAGWNATNETYTVIDSLSTTANNGDSAVYSVDGYVYSYISGADWVSTSKYTPQSIPIDSALSDTSTNAVQNKVVAIAIDDVADKANANAENIITLRNSIELLNGGTSSQTATIPSYWENEVAEKSETVKALQSVGGKNCVSFLHAGDLHINDNDNGRTNDIGKVMNAMLVSCNMPYAVLSGDINTRASYSTEEGLLSAQAQMPVHLAPLWGTERLLVALGNHDGCYGDSSGYYRHQFNPERMWNIYFRWQALDFRKVFSDDGLYFYIDNVTQKTRFIVLNSNFGGEYAEDGNGWAVNNRFGTSCYGQTQLDWLKDIALDMPNEYSAVIFGHVPPNVNYTVDKSQFIGIVDAYNNKTKFSGSYTTGINGWTNSTVDVDFTGARGEIIAMFTGHVHGDSVDTTTMSCPIITILSAGAGANEPYKESAPTRTSGTATETSFDAVTINKQSRTIYCTRVGAGNDREINY